MMTENTAEDYAPDVWAHRDAVLAELGTNFDLWSERGAIADLQHEVAARWAEGPTER